MDLVEGVGESSSPPRSFGSFGGYDIRNDVYNRLVESGNEEAVCNPEFRELLDAHFNRLPSSYGLDINMDRVEDILLHQKLLVLAKDPDNRPVYHVRFLENFLTKADGDDEQQEVSVPSTSRQCCNADSEGVVPSHNRSRDYESEFEPCSKLEDLNLDVRKNSNDIERRFLTENFSRRQEVSHLPIHEVIFSTVDKPKLLSQLSALLSDIGLNIREAHVFSTTDGYSLDVFVVDGWPVEDTEGLYKAMEKAIARNEGSWSGSSQIQSAVEKALVSQGKSGDWEIDRRLLKIGERIASGSCGDLYRGVYLGQDVAIKVLRSEHLNDALEDEFAQEVAILREVQHRNVVRFVGACTKAPHLCIVTEYMPGGSLYEYIHKNHIVLNLPQLLQFAIDVCSGMEYLHQNDIIHRDLKTANLLMDNDKFRRVANLYFLMVSILSSTPLSPISPITNVLPLSVVLFVSLVKEAWEDWKRLQNDKAINNSSVEVLEDQKWESVPWKSLQVGDLVRVKTDGYFPADLLFLASTNADGVCYVETANLDGETNLKIRKALEKTWDYVTIEKASEFKAEVQCEQPNNSLYTFTGNLITEEQTLPLSPNQLLLRGCSLRNTVYIIGAVIFSGPETKVMMNSMNVPSKRSTLERKLDKLILTLFGVLFCMCLIGAIGSGVFINSKYYFLGLHGPNLTPDMNPNNGFVVAFLNMFTLITLYSPIIPISLYVSIETIKFIQSNQYINNDLHMYHVETNTPALARTSNLNEELGQVEYIFSDKTGTLMEFFKCSIWGEVYGTGLTEIEIGGEQRSGIKVDEAYARCLVE